MTLDELMTEALAEPGDADAPHPLTPREQEVADLVVQGLNNVEIARKLFISRRTVESHVEHIKQKLDLTTRHQVVVWGAREAPVTPDRP
jgi:DNA-binding NarL/FixJ family response regulator